MKQTDVIKMIGILKETYPDAKCSLDFTSPFEMMVAVMLSAQCTDARVNLTTPSLFEKYHTPETMASMDLSLLEKIIHPCGFYKNKAKNIKATAQKLVQEFHSEVPHTMEELMSLPGVGRKSANVVMLEAFQDPQGIAVDTHVKRISNRIGLSSKLEPIDIEQDLLTLIPKQYYQDVNHIFIWHGRNTCTSQNPKCAVCPIQPYCKFYQSKPSQK